MEEVVPLEPLAIELAESLEPLPPEPLPPPLPEQGSLDYM